MAAKFKFLLLYFLSWVIFFDLMRLVFLCYHYDKTKTLSAGTVLSSFWYGMRMDLSVAAYILAPMCLFVLLSLVIPLFRRVLIYQAYTYLVLLIVSLLSFFDLEIYKQWGFRIDATPLKFLSTPREAFASISHLPLVMLFLVFLAAYLLLCFLFTKLLKKIFFEEQQRRRLVTAFLILLFMGSLIIPIRGGLQLAPLNQSAVYFSTNSFANHTAVNATWNFLHSVVSKGSSGKNPYQYLPAIRMQQVTDSLFSGSSGTPLYFRNSGPPVNIILVIWESFTAKVVDTVVMNQEVTPNFNRLRKEGIYFSNLYASGDRTNKGIPAILSGYPAMPNTTIIHSPSKSERLPVLPGMFEARGYAKPFFYGGEPEFANIKSYLLHAGFNPIIGKDDFAAKDMNSKWGAHDGVVMQRVIHDLQHTKHPFFATWLTLTSHEPFETPVAPVFPQDDNTNKFLNSLHYTDGVLSSFIDSCKKATWWNNTVIVITGDHGHPLPATGNKIDEFRTPMLWLGGALQQRGVVIDRIVSQLDIAAMLAMQLGFPAKQFPYSKNALDTAARPWAFFTFNDGFGFVNERGRLAFDNVGKQPIVVEGAAGVKEIEAGKALMDTVYSDFLKK